MGYQHSRINQYSSNDPTVQMISAVIGNRAAQGSNPARNNFFLFYYNFPARNNFFLFYYNLGAYLHEYKFQL